jgi:hypothetical protein
LRIDGAEIEEGTIKVAVKDRENTYEFAET